jgi:hypothetical protein
MRNTTQENKHLKMVDSTIETLPDKDNSNKDQVSLAGVINAAAGALAYDATKALLTSDDNKPVTKADFKHLATLLKRYHKIVGQPPRIKGSQPYFDLETKRIVYIKSWGKP